jgi:hypothetical protein
VVGVVVVVVLVVVATTPVLVHAKVGNGGDDVSDFLASKYIVVFLRALNRDRVTKDQYISQPNNQIWCTLL